MAKSVGTPTDDDLIEIAKSRGRKLGVLIAAANMPNEVKDALLTLLPYFSLEQLDRFTTILEAQYLDEEAEKTIGDKFSQELKDIIAKYERDSAENLAEAKMKIEKLKVKIK